LALIAAPFSSRPYRNGLVVNPYEPYGTISPHLHTTHSIDTIKELLNLRKREQFLAKKKLYLQVWCGYSDD
jgi:hypothetical protein